MTKMNVLPALARTRQIIAFEQQGYGHMAAAISALHWPETNAHGVRVVRIPDPRSLHFHQVWGDYWPEDSWMGRRVNIVTHGQPMELRISGQYRPVELGPVEIRATVNGSEMASCRYPSRSQEDRSPETSWGLEVREARYLRPGQHCGRKRLV